MHGLVPPLADCFNTRPETGPAALDAQPAGQLLVLAAPPGPAADWPGGTGKTQLAVHLAQTWCHTRADALLIWVTASSRAAVLSSYVQAFAERTGMAPAATARRSRPGSWPGWPRRGRGWWCWMTCPTRPTWTACGRPGRAWTARGCLTPGRSERNASGLNHFFVIWKNNGFHDVIGNPAAPNLNALARRFGLATDYFGVSPDSSERTLGERLPRAARPAGRQARAVLSARSGS